MYYVLYYFQGRALGISIGCIIGMFPLLVFKGRHDDDDDDDDDDDEAGKTDGSTQTEAATSPTTTTTTQGNKLS